MENRNSPVSVLAVLSGLPSCRRKVRAVALGLEARGRPEGPTVKSAHQSGAAVSCFFKVAVCTDWPAVLWTMWLLFFATAFLPFSLVFTPQQFQSEKKRDGGRRAQGKTNAIQRSSKKTAKDKLPRQSWRM